MDKVEKLLDSALVKVRFLEKDLRKIKKSLEEDRGDVNAQEKGR